MMNGDCWPKSISVAERLSAAACEKPVRVTSREPTLQSARSGPSFADELAAASEKVSVHEPLGATVSWLTEACAQVVLERVSVYGVREGPASRDTANVCGVPSSETHGKGLLCRVSPHVAHGK